MSDPMTRLNTALEGRYHIERELGEGGMGIVYRASHGMMRRPTAVKLLKPEHTEEAALKRFEREARAEDARIGILRLERDGVLDQGSPRLGVAAATLVVMLFTLDGGDPDPGEVVWTWVPFEEDPDQGKDRPVVVIGRRGRSLVGVPLTTRQNGREAQISIGTGDWDPKRRQSYARIWRMLDIDADRGGRTPNGGSEFVGEERGDRPGAAVG